ncbi:MAG: hypothetical protein NUV80_02930 [Candidatus Berkelbacteria bacterium]|nr:hypothetical protein [Candidatus Berkelbacteria bacterium]
MNETQFKAIVMALLYGSINKVKQKGASYTDYKSYEEVINDLSELANDIIAKAEAI